jgi:hypothetical protein
MSGTGLAMVLLLTDQRRDRAPASSGKRPEVFTRVVKIQHETTE